MKRTAFYEIHRSLGGKIVEFGGFEMPVQYTGIIDEHLAVRNGVGVFDVSHMGEFEVGGKGALSFLQEMTVNDVSKLSNGKVQYSAMCYDDGGIVDDLLVYHCGDYYMLVVNAANLQKDFDWLRSHVSGDVTLKDRSDSISLLAVQGPKAAATLQKLTDTDLSRVEYYHYVRGMLAGEQMIVSRTGYTGEPGFELYFSSDPNVGEKVWKTIFEAGREFGIKPVGLGARDTLRLEMGFCLYGNDIDQSTNPLEAGLGWITKFDKGEFVGRRVLVKAKQEGVKRKLCGFMLPDRTLARHGYMISSNGSTVGQVTSGTFSPSLHKGIGMGYVRAELAKPGEVVNVEIRGKEVPGTIMKLPFYQRS